MKEAQAHEGAASVFTYPKFASHGKYTAYLPIDGHQELVRTPDGIHLTPAGNDLLTADVMKALGTIYRLPKTSH